MAINSHFYGHKLFIIISKQPLLLIKQIPVGSVLLSSQFDCKKKAVSLRRKQIDCILRFGEPQWAQLAKDS